MNTSIRDAHREDLEQIAIFQIQMARLTEGRELSLEQVRRGVRAVMEDPNLGFYLVAEGRKEGEEGDEGETLLGSLLVTREWSDWRSGWFWWIQSVYVSEPARRRGVYRALHNEVRDRARKEGDVVGLRLYVEASNRNAMRVYQRIGMKETPYRIYEEEL